MKSSTNRIHETKRDGLWAFGNIDGYTYSVKAYSTGSEEFGIDGGKISKLTIKDEAGKTVLNYDRDWDSYQNSKALESAYKEIVRAYN